MRHPSQPVVHRVLITGASGFTGAYLREELADAGYEVIGTTAGASQANERTLDITSLPDCRRLIGELKPEFIVHLAAISFVAHDDLLEMYNVNVIGTTNLLRACIDVGHEPRKILIASSANVYGNTEGVVDEDTPAAPVNHYAASKLAMEHLVRTWFDRLPIVVTRPFNYTGRGQSERFLVPKIVSHVVQRRSFIELGNLDVARDFSDVRTVVRAYRALLEAPVSGETFNVCSGNPRSLLDILDLVRHSSGHDLQVRVNPAFVRHDEVKMLAGSSDRLRRIVPDVNDIDFCDTIDWMLART
ncbi:NAD-dependent epimerase/dehydratase [Paraburkholderia hospita]|uniref:NAD-dependent epimerase/dehydratase n=1 Tax=Paraburkholderia hospita TaxID=169430 RepID=A0ABN0FCV8_9BURK|nr:NAD-dependent epimerase/dehydratase family protein [Paraburkholderia hospita]EIM96486.1 NAD-dependent epimerase/dehydratase [Paraburkholderia hospita]OUL93400.1 GDP-mannose 4,6 dehydratase [Paraburkholderia hospita]